MSTRALARVDPWSNPVFERYWRSRLRLRRAVFWVLLVLVAATFQTVLTWVIETNRGRSPVQAARELWIGLLVIQGLVLMVKGTGAVSAGLIQDKLDETLDYQRLTPMTPLRSLVGYLFGLPVLEYGLFALTLPHLAFIVVVGEIPLTTLASVYLVFFCCVMLYHMTGLAAGMVMQRWLVAYMLSGALVVFVNLILPMLVSQAGLNFLQYLSVWPVISQKVLPLVAPAQIASGNPFLSLDEAVPFYAWTLTPFVFTLLLQGVLIVTFATMALRRWKSASRHSLSKPYALAFLIGFIVLLTGNVWPVITGQYLPFPIFGITDIDQLGESIAIALPLVYCFVVWSLSMMLFMIVLPSHDAYVRGIRRAMKFGRTAARPWDDDSASPWSTALFVGVAVAGFAVIYNELEAAGFLTSLVDAGFRPWRLPLAFALVVAYTALLIQVFEMRPTNVAILLLWLVPILVAIILTAASETFGTLPAVIASVSPLALLFMAALLPTRYLPSGIAGDELDAAVIGVGTGLAFVVLQIVLLAWRWRLLSARFYLACSAGNTNT